MRTASKVLKFPLSGVARDLDYRKAYIPSEESTFATPFAVNVRGADTFGRRNRGGSRPGLKVVNAPNVGIQNNPHYHPIVSGIPAITPSTTCVYRERHCFASGIAWYMSSIGNHTDWEFNGDADNPARAFSGSIANAGLVGDTITALMPIRDDYLFIATKHSIWCLTGDPIGGTIRCVSERVGCISKDAWCFDGARIWVISNNGLYSFSVGEMPMLMSQRIPEEFVGLADALAVYDAEEDGIHIFGEAGANASDWFIDIANKAFWRMSFKAAHRPTEAVYAVVNNVESVIFHSGDTSWRKFDDDETTDSEEVFSSKVAIGPVRCSDRDDMDGMIAELEGVIADGSCDVNCAIYTAHSPEEAVKLAYNEQGAPFTLSLKQGWNNVVRPRKRGSWAVFVLSASGRWGYESMTAVSKHFGRLR